MKIMLNKELLEFINRAKEIVRASEAYQDICEDHAADPVFLTYVPIVFADLDVSARTDNGVIYINEKYSKDLDAVCHYITHEFTHWCQQCLGDAPTVQQAENYLEDENELEAFEHQVDFIQDNEGDEEAREYVNRLLDHHDVEGDEKEQYEEFLLND